MSKVKPLKARIHTLSQLQSETLNLIRKVRHQLQRSPHDPGLNDTEFLDQIVQPLEDKICQDRQMMKILKELFDHPNVSRSAGNSGEEK